MKGKKLTAILLIIALIAGNVENYRVYADESATTEQSTEINTSEASAATSGSTESSAPAATENGNTEVPGTKTPGTEASINTPETEVPAITDTESNLPQNPATEVPAASTEPAQSTETETVVSEQENTETMESETTTEDTEKKDPTVIEVSDITSFTQAVNAVKINDDLTPAYTFTAGDSTAYVDGNQVHMDNPAVDNGDSLSVPASTFSGDPQIASGEQKKDVVDLQTVADNSSLQIQKNGDTVDLVDPYQTKRLIVISQNGFDPYGADTIIRYSNIYILSYATEDLTKEAFNYLKTVPGITVEADSSMNISDESEEGSAETQLSSAVASMTDGMQSNPLKEYIDKHATDTQVNVAVVDTGINAGLPEFTNRVIDKGYNFATGSQAGSIDENSHGTAVSYLIATNTGSNIKIVPYKVAGESGRATASGIYAAVETAIAAGEDVINISLNSAATDQSEIVTTALNDAYNAGLTVVVSAGNAGNDVYYYSPSNVASAIVVGSVDNNMNQADFSNYGDTLDYVSDGTALKVKDKDGNEQTTQGTSFSAAFITAAVAEIKSADKSQTPDTINGILSSLSKDLGETGWDKKYGNGYLGFSFTKVETIPSNKQVESLLDYKNWKELSAEKLRQLYANSNIEEIATFLQKNKSDLDLIRQRIPALDNTIQTGQGETVAYEYYLNIDLSAFTTAKGPDGGISMSTGYFYTYVSSQNNSTADGSTTVSWYKINLIKDANSSFDSGQDDNDISKRLYQVSLERVDASGNASTDYFGFSLTANLQYSADKGYRRAGGASSETANGVTCYSVYVIYAQFTQTRYHIANVDLDRYIVGRRLNTRTYTTDNSGSETLNTTSYNTSDQTYGFRIQINTANTGQGSYYNTSTGKWTDSSLVGSTSSDGTQSVFGIAKIKLIPYSTTAYSSDYRTNGTYIGSSGGGIPVTYSNTSISGANWGTATPIAGYTFSSASSANYDGANYTSATPMYVARYFAPITYTVRYNGNGNTGGSTADASYTYDTSSSLSINGFIRSFTLNYDANGGKTSASGNPTTKSQSTVSTFGGWYKEASTVNPISTAYNLLATSGIYNVYAKWTDNTQALLSATRTGFDFLGWSTTQTATAPDAGYEAGKTVTVSANRTLYAIWKLKTYVITYNANGGSGSMAAGSKTWGTGYTLLANGFTRSGYDFVGWSTNASLDPLNATPEYHPGDTYSTESALTLYAIWTPRIEVAYIGNEQTKGSDFVDSGSGSGIALSDTYNFSDNQDTSGNDIFTKDAEATYTDAETGDSVVQDITSTIVGWSYRSNTNINDKIYKESEAIEAQNLFKGANDVGAITYGSPNSDYGKYPITGAKNTQVSTQMKFSAKLSSFAMSAVNLDDLQPVEIAAAPLASSGSSTPVINMYGVWDNGPTVEGYDLYYSLDFAQSTTVTTGITMDELLSYVTVTDQEDSKIVKVATVPDPGSRAADTTYVTVMDYSVNDFTGFTNDGSVTITYTAMDSAGNTTEKQVTVHIVDSAPKNPTVRTYTRFINEKYYGKSYSEGGLEDKSLWLTDSSYIQEIKTAFANDSNDTPEATYEFTRDQIVQMQAYVDQNGIGNSTNSNALSNFASEFLQ